MELGGEVAGVGADEPESSFIRASSLESSSLSCTFRGRIQKMIHIFCMVDSFPDCVLEPGNETVRVADTVTHSSSNCLQW